MVNLRTNNTAVIGVNVSTSYDMTTRIFDTNTPHKIMMVGTARSGPINQRVAVTSFAEFRQIFGGHIDGSYSYHAARAIFDGWGGGTAIKPSMYFVRVDGPAVATASYTLEDSQGEDTLKIEFAYPTEDGNLVQFKKTAGTKVYYVANPGAAPNITASTTGGTVPAATYDVVYAWNNYNGDTLISQIKQVTTTGSTSKLAVTAPLSMPYGADKIKVYVKVSDHWRLAATSASGANTVEVIAIPSGGADQNVLTTTCSIPTMKLEFWMNGVFAFDWDNLTLSDSDISSFNGSQAIVKLTNLYSTTAVPENLPVTMTDPLFLQGGVSDISNVTDAIAVGTINTDGDKTGLQIFRDDLLGNGTIIAPGFTGATVWQELADIAEDYYRLAIADAPYNSTIDDIETLSESGVVDSTALIVCFPSSRAIANADYINGRGPERLWIPTSIDKAGGTYKAAATISPFQSAAGDRFNIPLCPPADKTHSIGGLYKDVYGNDFLDATKATELSDSFHICTIRNISQSGPTLYDNMLFGTSSLIKFEQERKILNYLFHIAVKSFKNVPFQNLDAQTYREVLQDCQITADNICQVVGNQGGLVGVANGFLSEDTSTGYRIVCGPENNDLNTLQQGFLFMDIYYRNVPAVRKFIVRLHPRNLTDSLD